MKNVQYTFVDNQGSLVFRSTVNSFGLDHVTDKDIVSFYTNFSSAAYFDTGLLPVDGSGLLSIRTAGNHTQIAYQHKPGMYYVNWGTYEGDKNAIKYYVAQPYRIVIADLLNGNIYGARTFYSPVPITHPDLPLYHVNLPNINCKGYRGNGVGWICLYHTEDISSYPFNEKLSKILDRCSGTEAYNDNNMSETDGPRFYRENGKPDYLCNPHQWQSYSNDNGYEWTLDPDLWIPVLVEGHDSQSAHCASGQPLTFVNALLGNYQAYYSDNIIPKPVNSITRHDMNLDPSQVFNWFKVAYNASRVDSISVNPYSSTLEIREQLSQSAAPSFDEDSDEDSWYCEDCSDTFSEDTSPNSTYNSSYICDSCFENYNYCHNTDAYHYCEDTLHLDQSDLYIYTSSAEYNIDYKWCHLCDNGYYKTHPHFDQVVFHADDQLCDQCHKNSAPQQSSPGPSGPINFQMFHSEPF